MLMALLVNYMMEALRCVSNQKLKARIAKMQKAANCLAAF